MFKTNDNLDVKVTTIKGHQAVIIDNFYENPDEVRERALTEEYSDDEGLCSGFPGWRIFKRDNDIQTYLYNLFLELAIDNGIWDKKNLLDIREFDKSWNSAGFMVNLLNDESLIKDPLAIVPHQDAYTGVKEPGLPNFQFGANIYLNSPEECAGGTAIYSFNGDVSIPQRYVSGIPIPDNEENLTNAERFKHVRYHTRNGPHWKVEHELEMVYNRMVMYEADLLHDQSVDLGMFTNYHRMNQVIFM